MDINKITNEIVSELIDVYSDSLLEGTEVGDDVVCPKCDHDWEIRKEDKRPFLCHNCGWDTMIDKYDMEALKRWKKTQLDEIPIDKLKQVDTFADKQLNPVDVDLTGRHFFDRLRDPRNKKEISQAELIGFFKRLKRSKDEFIDFLKKYNQVVVTDKRTNLNIPFMKKANRAIAKTIMRKSNFKTSNVKLQVSHKENFDRTKFYENYYRNLSSNDFRVTSSNGKVIIEIKEKSDINENVNIDDRGGEPYVVNLEDLTVDNQNFRTTKWTGENLQMTLMSVEDEIGMEVHESGDQFLRIEEGKGKVVIGDSEDNIILETDIEDDFAIFIPAGSYHNIINTGDTPLKLYAIYAPPEHSKGKVDIDKP